MLNLRLRIGAWWFCAEGGGGREIVANRHNADTWETFTLTNLSGGRLKHGSRIALRANNGRYVYAQGGGGGRLYAKGLAVGDWEPFTVYDVIWRESQIIDGRIIALQAANGQFVYAQNGGGGAVYARGASIGDWERLEVRMWRTCTLQSVHGKYVSLSGDGFAIERVIADRDSASDWERFRFHPTNGWPFVHGDNGTLITHNGKAVYVASDGQLEASTHTSGQRFRAHVLDTVDAGCLPRRA
jgi:hypothetical protein